MAESVFIQMNPQKNPSLTEKECASGIRLVRGVGMTHDFPRHVHQSMMFVWVTGGARDVDVFGKTIRIAAGQGFCLPPECVHACRSFEPHDYYAVSVPAHFCETLRDPDVPAPAFTVFDEREDSGAALHQLIAVLRADPDLMAIESALLSVLTFVQPSHPVATNPQYLAVVNRVREYLLARFSEPVRLSDLAELTGWSAGMVNRIFSAHVGVPPYEFLLHQRLREVARLLRSGSDALAEIAAATGFADQSHMQRLFRRAFGVTPKAYRQGAGASNGLTSVAD